MTTIFTQKFLYGKRKLQTKPRFFLLLPFRNIYPNESGPSTEFDFCKIIFVEYVILEIEFFDYIDIFTYYFLPMFHMRKENI